WTLQKPRIGQSLFGHHWQNLQTVPPTHIKHEDWPWHNRIQIRGLRILKGGSYKYKTSLSCLSSVLMSCTPHWCLHREVQHVCGRKYHVDNPVRDFSLFFHPTAAFRKLVTPKRPSWVSWNCRTYLYAASATLRFASAA